MKGEVEKNVRPHHKLRVWQEAVRLVKSVYDATKTFPADERFGLTSQIRRAAVSVPSNIAEGAARETRKEFLHFLVMARGSLSEIETQIRIAQELGFLTQPHSIETELTTVFSLLGGLIKTLRRQAGP